MEKDIRWVQRFNNYLRAFSELEKAVVLAKNRDLSNLEKQGLIQGFEYTHELAWKVLKDYLSYQGIQGLIGSKDSTREAFKNGLIGSGEIWMDMIQSRNLTSHIYDTELANTIFQSIVRNYFPEFEKLKHTFNDLMEKENT